MVEILFCRGCESRILGLDEGDKCPKCDSEETVHYSKKLEEVNKDGPDTYH